MSFKTPMRTRSSLGNSSSASVSSLSTPTRPSSSAKSTFRPPSRPTVLRSSSPVLQHHHHQQQSQPRSRPGSSLGTSRPGTPVNSGSYCRQEPYTGTITVSIRPNPESFTQGAQQNWYINSYNSSISHVDGSSFVFDNVFDNDVYSNNNYQVYLKACKPIVEKFLDEGYNGTVFAYGMTGSGKTYSMKGNEKESGFVEMAVNDLFDKIGSLGEEVVKHQINVSYLEIYNERIIDLLNTGNGSINGNDLKIRDDPEFGVKVTGLTTPIVTSKEQLLTLIRRGDLNRKTSATDFNARSSRSHSILQIRLKIVNEITSCETTSTLSLCDLAGSERASSSLERRKEGSYINKSLLALSNVINKLSASSHGVVDYHISYRDSKLTRILQPALSGRSLVSILCTIHMGCGSNATAQQTVSETYKTLRFAARAKDIVINVEKNVGRGIEVTDPETSKLIQELNNTIEQQRHELLMLKSSGYTDTSSPVDTSVLDNALKAENKVLMEKVTYLSRLTDLQKTETVIVKDSALNDIIGSGADNAQIYVANIEELYKRITHERNEYDNYIARLEQQLKIAYTKNPHRSTTNSDNKELMEVLKEQEDEIMQLKETIKDKDHIIKSFSKSSRLRKLVESNAKVNVSVNKTNYVAMDQEYKRSMGIHSQDSDVTMDKENEVGAYDFSVGPKKARACFDIVQTL
ncbi:KIP2 [Candida theae]|uniref:Kinesin-like protein n=1 Tax=Candida theae TaxID=1198502 RepID=A0AAD5FVP2_9ASCO|nr:KIP2 [Candida theae]KAI5948714.1 KIP2 [Candida theae]